jgi:hypothetical protein
MLCHIITCIFIKIILSKNIIVLSAINILRNIDIVYRYKHLLSSQKVLKYDKKDDKNLFQKTQSIKKS